MMQNFRFWCVGWSHSCPNHSSHSGIVLGVKIFLIVVLIEPKLRRRKRSITFFKTVTVSSHDVSIHVSRRGDGTLTNWDRV